MSLPKAEAKKWCTFLLGIHDLGKFAESFQQLRPDLRSELWPGEKIRKTQYSVRHDSLGKMVWDQCLVKALFFEASESLDDFVQDTFPHWLSAVFGHHGWPPSYDERSQKYFRDFDQQAALDFYQQWFDLIRPDMSQLAEKASDKSWQAQQKEASWLIAGIAVLADWLGSNQEVFEFRSQPMDLDDYWQKFALPSAKKAITAAGFLPSTLRHQQSLKDFFPYIETPTPLQQICSDISIANEPQLFILEDVTGAGKTEAALMLAHRLIDAGLAEGLYIGLPTMATANAMYERMLDTYRRFYAESEKPSLILSHSARHLSEKFQQSLLEPQRRNQDYGDEESITAQCNRWLADNRKKALLADIGIGTIDQALLAVMPARHQSLRLLGLINKVLILDEVHAYDPYTSEPLKKLMKFHAALGGSIILLSATLTQKQRQQFVSSFQSKANIQPERTEYPLLTHVSISGNIQEIPLKTRDSVKRSVEVSFCHSEDKVYSIIQEAVNNGRCVCWIRNTVTDAREAWQQLTEVNGMPNEKVHLFHSRYAMSDRIQIEQEILGLFGKSSTPAKRKGQVLIATQVVEQSLDLDFDVMISDLAPIDLLIQRAGRLHRHQRGDRGKPVLHIHSPEPDSEPGKDWYKTTFPKANFVYPHTLVLWRTAEILADKHGWKMPSDARELLEYVYNEGGEIPSGLMDTMLEMEGESISQKDAGIFASLRLESGYSGSERWDEEARIATRLGEETHTLYLARWGHDELIPWRNEGRYCWDLSSLRVNQQQLQELAPLDDTALQQALDQLREKENLFDEHSFILPLVFNDQCWKGSGLNGKGKPVSIIYDTKSGLELIYE
jgi:CRISPR-associated endonuclease/helicase Cas3